MKKATCFLCLVLIGALLCAETFVGNWRVTYRLAGLPWTDYIQIVSVNSEGKVFALDGSGNRIFGFVKNGVAVIKGADNPYYLDTWIFDTTHRASKHMGFCSDLQGNLQGEIQNAAALKITNMPTINPDNDRPWDKMKAAQSGK